MFYLFSFYYFSDKEPKKMNWKKLIFKLGGIFIVTVYFTMTSIPTAQAANNGFEIDKVITAIKQEIQSARKITGRPRLKIDSVELELSIITEHEAEGGVKVKVADIGAKIIGGIDKRTIQKLKLSFTPSGSVDISKTSNLGLVGAISEVKAALQKARKSNPKFELKKFTFEIEFYIKTKSGGEISFWIIDLLDVKAKNIVTHKMKIHMSLAKKR
jgi:hypothetical protein